MIIQPASMRRNYGLACAVLLCVLGFVSYEYFQQSRAQAQATADALYHEDVRTALWRMETRVGALMATTAVRRSASVDVALLSNSWIAPANNEVRDVEAPGGELRDAIVAAADKAYDVAIKAVPADEAQRVAGHSLPGTSARQGVTSRGASRSQNEFARRAYSSNLLQNVLPDGEAAWRLGPLAPVWEGEGDQLELFLARRVESPVGASHESYQLQWSELKELLLSEVRDLFPMADLVPSALSKTPASVTSTTAADAFRLAAIPARLVATSRPEPNLQRAPFVALGIGWFALLCAMAFGWVALDASLAFGQKHRRFTHAVTHELRTPLTTFRMYSEMLSRGMVPEGAQAEYLATLESEAVRLSGLVENVLRYAKLEEGGPAPEQETLPIGAMFERLAPALEAQCARADVTLEWDRRALETSSIEVTTDPGAVQQILTNLVENACKYGGGGIVRLRAAAASNGWSVDVQDDGPGIPERYRGAIFEPFERAGRDGAEEAPGVGLGLALSRDLARELGGDVTLERSKGGSVFRLALPKA